MKVGFIARRLPFHALRSFRMSEHELEKLLGGFAADTLTQEEQQKLFSAALQDQQLFNALADEQALKELLADPVVRRRLLQALGRKGTAGAGSALSWLDWLKRPAGLAFAGGLAAAAFAVVLGAKIYQDSVKQAAPSAATEETKPTAPTPIPPTAPPAQPLAEKAENKAEKDALLDKTVKNERRTTAPSSQERHTSDIQRNRVAGQSKQEESPKQAEAPAASLGKEMKEIPASSGQKQPAQSSAPPIESPEPAQTQAPAGITSPGAGSSTASARALFYAGKTERFDEQAVAAQKERRLKAFSESAPQADRPERKPDQFAAAGKATQFWPLGLRYSFMTRGQGGQDQEVDAVTASKSTERTHLTVEANQDAYVQVWRMEGSSTPELLYPEKDSGQISTKLPTGQRQMIPLPTEIGSFTLIVRLSRFPFGPITRQEATMLDRLAPNQVRESVSAGSPSGSQEYATYIVNQDVSRTAQIAVEIPLGR